MNEIKVVHDVLTAARELISVPERWTQRFYAKTSSGEWVPPSHPNAACFCSVGALEYVTSDRPVVTASVLVNQASKRLAACMGDLVPRFNDNHTHEEVLAAWDKAIEAIANESQ